MKRYNLISYDKLDAWMEEHPQGKYCLYEDVPQWVSVKEKLPSPMEMVWFYGKLWGSKRSIIGWYDPDYKEYPFRFLDIEDSHVNGWHINHPPEKWAPIPQPPEDSDDD